MKKLVSLFLSMIILMLTMAVPAMAGDDIKVVLDGQEVQFDVQPQIVNERTMVPVRAIFEALGATVEWNQSAQTITSQKGDIKVNLSIGNSFMTVNDKQVALDQPACVINERTLVPVRAIAEAYGTTVEWDASSKTVSIKSSNYSEPVVIHYDNIYANIIQIKDMISRGLYLEAIRECDQTRAWHYLSAEDIHVLDHLRYTAEYRYYEYLSKVAIYNIPPHEHESVNTNDEERKPYKVETITAADVKEFGDWNGYYGYRAFYVQDDHNYFYYYDNSTRKVIKVNMISREKSLVCKPDELTVTYDGNQYSKMDVNGMFYDTYSDSLALYGSFSGGKTTFEKVAEPFYCVVELKNLKVTTFEGSWDGDYRGSYVYAPNLNFFGTLNNGDYLVRKNNYESFDYIMSRHSRELKVLSTSKFYAPFTEYNGDIYHVGLYERGQGLYVLNETGDNKLSGMAFGGIANNKAYALNKDSIGIYTLEGDLVNTISFEDIELKDNNKVSAENIDYVLMAASNDNIVFYDSWMKAFRIISKNG